MHKLSYINLITTGDKVWEVTNSTRHCGRYALVQLSHQFILQVLLQILIYDVVKVLVGAPDRKGLGCRLQVY